MFIKSLSTICVLSFSLLIPNGAIADSNTPKVNINTAPVEVLDTQLVGVGVEKAKAIVDYREKHGPFKSLEELQKVNGIGDKIIESNKSKIIFSESPAGESTSPEKTEAAKEKTPATGDIVKPEGTAVPPSTH